MNAQKNTIIFVNFTFLIYICHVNQMIKDQDYLFESEKMNFGFFTHIINFETSTVIEKNNDDNYFLFH